MKGKIKGWWLAAGAAVLMQGAGVSVLNEITNEQPNEINNIVGVAIVEENSVNNEIENILNENVLLENTENKNEVVADKQKENPKSTNTNTASNKTTEKDSKKTTNTDTKKTNTSTAKNFTTTSSSKSTQSSTGTSTKNTQSPSGTTSKSSTSGTTSSVNNNTNSEMVWIGETGTKYHYQNCRTLKGKGHQITLKQALQEGREPCKVCH